jgi:hypothetical protein
MATNTTDRSTMKTADSGSAKAKDATVPSKVKPDGENNSFMNHIKRKLSLGSSLSPKK